MRTLPQLIPVVTNRWNFEYENSTSTSSIQINAKNLKIIEIEPDKTSKNLKICSINPRSVKNKTIAICDYIISNDFDVVAITETWLSNSIDKTCSSELVPNGYRMKQVPRPGTARGGGVAIIYKANLDFNMLSSSSDGNFSTFEHMNCNIAVNKYSMSLSVIYRPPPSQKNGLSTTDFLENEWPLFLSQFAMTEKPVIIVGDLNFHLDKDKDPESIKFNNCLETFGMKQHVQGPTHVAGHTLDVIITKDTDNIVSNVEVLDPGLSDSSGKISRDHYAIIFNTLSEKPARIQKKVSFRKLRSIDINLFKEDVKSLEILNSNVIISDLDQYLEDLNNNLIALSSTSMRRLKPKQLS